ncbi:uncharacterized protein EAF02_007321 [Botrytis sinoallii]|uniref:uncharacterized protein n=1 Tax=Botrytis sinoallii TaxID=1463999 RepID=UPI0018FF8163|nr:uncharacterized protein EAF02_007321 [Botrytis sinoallii]KAF7880475.1 hypothetical protein EAF02_007321 [Botrytis sinoallii]
MPRNTSHVSTRVVAAAPHSSHDMVVHNPRNAAVAEALDSPYRHNTAVAVGPHGLIEVGGDLRRGDYELSDYHKKTLNSCLQKEVHEHNHTRSKLQDMQAAFMVAEGHASSLNVYSSELYECNKDLQKRTNIAEEALHVSQIQLAGSQQKICALERALNLCQMKVAESQLLSTENPERDQIMLKIPLDIKGRSCACTGRNIREVLNFRLKIPLEVDDGQCVCEGGSGPTIHEVHRPTLVQLGTSVDNRHRRSTSKHGQISPLWLNGDPEDVTREVTATSSVENTHTLHGQRIDLVNHTIQTLEKDSNNRNSAATDVNCGEIIEHVVRIDDSTNPKLKTTVGARPTSIHDDQTLPKTPESKLPDIIEVIEEVHQGNDTPTIQHNLGTDNLALASTSDCNDLSKAPEKNLDRVSIMSMLQANEHNDRSASAADCDNAEDRRNKRKLSTISDVMTWCTSQSKRSRL